MTPSSAPRTTPPSEWRRRFALVGPGIVLAMSSVGASDMITTLSAGAQFGLGLIWVFTLGILLKFVLSDAVSRLQMTGERTLISHLSDIGGRTFPAIFFVAELAVGLFFGASVVSVTTLVLQTLFPGVPFWPTAIVVLLSAVVLVGIGRYGLVEKAMMGFGLLMFLGIVFLAVSTLLGAEGQRVAAQTLPPVLPGGSIVTVLSLIGGVGGATGILAYSFWVREKGWHGPGWKPVIRLDLGISYFLVFTFATAMTMVGAFLLYGTDAAVEDNAAIVGIADALVAPTGEFGRTVFLVSFLAIVYTSVLGGFSGIAYVTADCLRVLRRFPHQDSHEDPRPARSPEFRIALAYLAVCTVAIIGLGRPVTLVLVYSAISALILPVLAYALLILLRRRSVAPELRNTPAATIGLLLCLLLFGFLAVVQLRDSFLGLLG